MNRHSIINFGKYKGRTIEEIWVGIIDQDQSEVIKNYLQEFFDFLSGSKQKNVCIPISDADLNSCWDGFNLFVKDVSLFKVNVTDKYIVIETKDTNLQKSLNKVICTCITGSYRTIVYGARLIPKNDDKEKCDYSDNSKKLINLQSNPRYFKWCIDEIERFFIDPDELDELIKMKSRYLDTFEITNIKEDIIEYKPIFKEYNFKLPIEAEKKNRKKFDNYELRDNNNDFDGGFDDYGDFGEPSYCEVCQESPCMCSDPEGTSSVYG